MKGQSTELPPGRLHECADMTALLLVGGMGTRLRNVLPSTPKPLAPLGNESFLALLIRQLGHQGVRRLVMCTGYLGDQIEDTFGTGKHLDVAISYSREASPMGTAGAVKAASHYLEDVADFLVLNGDSFIQIDFAQLIQFHRQHGGLVSVAVSLVENAGRYGTVQVSSDSHVTSFMEKTGSDKPGLVNAGVYVFNKAILDHIEAFPASLELEILPRLLNSGVFALRQHGTFIDIGTPQDYARAKAISDRMYDAALHREHREQSS